MNEELYWSCGYNHDGDACLADALWHGVLLDGAGNHMVAMSQACDAHRFIMNVHMDYLHPMSSGCNLPGSKFCWPDNYCFYDWTDELTDAA